MQTRSSDENSICLSVRPSVKRVDCDKTEEICPDFYFAIHSEPLNRDILFLSVTLATLNQF